MPFDVKFYLSIFWRRFPYFALVAALIGAIGISLASVMPSTYSAQAVLLIEREQIPADMMPSTVQAGVSQQVNLIRDRLTSRASLIDNAAALGLFREGGGMDPDRVVEEMRRRLAIWSRDNQVWVQYTAEDPQTAAAVANHFAAIIEREAIAMRRGVASTTLQFFREEVSRLNRELGIHRARVLDFRMQNRDRLPESLEFRRNRMAALQAQITRSVADEAALVARRDDLTALFAARGRITDELTPLERELASAQEELNRALRLFSPQNPRVRVITARVQELEQAVRAEGEDRADDLSAEFERRIADIEAEIARQQTLRAEAAAEIEELQRTIDETTITAVRLQELERELGYIHSQHDQIAGQLARAEMGERIELLARGQRIAILEQAWPPSAPVRPNRPQIAMAGVGGGIAAGLALIVLLEYFNRAIRRPAEITKRLGITPIATMPLLRSRREIRRRRMLLWGAFGVVLLGVPLALWWVHSFHLPLDLVIERVLARTGLGRLFGR